MKRRAKKPPSMASIAASIPRSSRSPVASPTLLPTSAPMPKPNAPTMRRKIIGGHWKMCSASDSDAAFVAVLPPGVLVPPELLLPGVVLGVGLGVVFGIVFGVGLGVGVGAGLAPRASMLLY